MLRTYQPSPYGASPCSVLCRLDSGTMEPGSMPDGRRGAGSWRPRPSPLRLDLDAASLRALRLRNGHLQDPVVELRLHPLLLEVAREAEAVGETSGSARLPPDDPLPLGLLDLARDRELV